MARIRVLIADDHAVVREGLARLIDDQPDMRMVGLAADGDAAIAAGQRGDPHVALLDMRMPGLGGVAAIRRMREACPNARVLVLSMYEDEHYRRAALRAGAHAYLGKRESAEVLLRAIRRLHAGEIDVADGGGRDSTPGAVLSAREREIMRLIVAGHTSRQVAAELGISKSSVDTYRARVIRKLGVDSRSALFASLSRLDEWDGES